MSDSKNPHSNFSPRTAPSRGPVPYRSPLFNPADPAEPSYFSISGAAPTFDPPEEADSAIIEDFLSPEFTLSQIARRAGTTLAELVHWMGTPETKARLLAIEEAYHRIAQLHIAKAMPLIQAARRTLAETANAPEPREPEPQPNLHRRRRHPPRRRGR